MSPEEPKPNKRPFDFLIMWSVTLPMILGVAVMGVLGHLADRALKIGFPIFTLLGIFASLIAVVIRLIRMLNKK